MREKPRLIQPRTFSKKVVCANRKCGAWYSLLDDNKGDFARTPLGNYTVICAEKCISLYT